MENEHGTSKEKRGFRWIDLNDPKMTDVYRPSPVSDPLSAYVVDLRSDPERVYQLVKKNQKGKRDKEQFIQDSQGRNLVIPITKGPVFEALCNLYDLSRGKEEARMIRLENRFSAEDIIPVVEIRNPFSHYDDSLMAEDVFDTYFPYETRDELNDVDLERIPQILRENKSWESLDLALDTYLSARDWSGRNWVDDLALQSYEEAAEEEDEGFRENGVNALEDALD